MLQSVGTWQWAVHNSECTMYIKVNGCLNDCAVHAASLTEQREKGISLSQGNLQKPLT